MKKNTKLVAVLSATALMSLGMSTMAFAAESGWKFDNGNWYYSNSSGDNVYDTWKKSGDFWYYLGEDGKMVTDAFIDDDDDFYYVNEDGVMVTNQWKFIETDDTDGEARWYYFGANGKAYKQGSSSKASLKEINGKKYIFDENGIMQYGWVNEDGEEVDEDDSDAWKDAIYYCGDEMDGAVATGWRSLDVDNDDDDDYPGYYWFYFKPATGKKVVSEDSYTINGKKYGFDENGAMLYEFSAVDTATSSNALGNYKYYQDYDNGANKRSGWFKAIPDEDIHQEGYDDGEERWFYANSNGTLKANCIASINGKKYAFNEYGEMLYGLRGIELDGNTIVDYTDELESLDDVEALDGSSYMVYYFGNENDGAMKKSGVTIDLDGDSYKYEFKSTGEGRNGIYKDVIYVNGRRIDADSDEGYIMVEEDGTKTTSIGTAYLVNTSGKIQKNKTNVKDKDDMYYCTDSDGVVIYRDSEKYKK